MLVIATVKMYVSMRLVIAPTANSSMSLKNVRMILRILATTVGVILKNVDGTFLASAVTNM